MGNLPGLGIDPHELIVAIQGNQPQGSVANPGNAFGLEPNGNLSQCFALFQRTTVTELLSVLAARSSFPSRETSRRLLEVPAEAGIARRMSRTNESRNRMRDQSPGQDVGEGFYWTILWWAGKEESSGVKDYTDLA